MPGHVPAGDRGRTLALLLSGALLGALLGFVLGSVARDQLCPPTIGGSFISEEQLREFVEEHFASLGCRLAPWVMWASVLLGAGVGGYLAWLTCQTPVRTPAPESGD